VEGELEELGGREDDVGDQRAFLESGPPAASIERCRFEIYSETRQKNAGKRSEEELATRKKKKRKEKRKLMSMQ
jgi:hypothetical protein